MKKIGKVILLLMLMMGLPTLTVLADSGFGETGFADSFGSDDQELKFSGDFKLDIRSILEDNKINTNPSLNLDLTYDNDNSQFKAALDFTDDSDPQLEEAYLKLYYDNFDLLAGKKKVVWGKGDKLHVVDNLNAEDLTDFLNPDYLDRKIAENMIKVNYYIGTGILEAVYEPGFTVNKLAESGIWAANELKLLNQAILTVAGSGDPYKAQVYSETLQPSYDEFEDGQLGLRYTNSQSGYDYGFSLYRGRLREASMNMQAVARLKDALANNNITSIKSSLDNLNIQYDRVTILGTEFSSVIAGINSRAELAYYLTEDRDGTDPSVHNNRIAWIIGGDKDLPIHNVNVNLQFKSQLILNKDEINSNQSAGDHDLEYDGDDNYLTNMIVAKVSDKFNNEKILPQISIAYNIEDEDYMIDNQLEYKLKDDTSLKFNYKIFGGDNDTTFGEFGDNDYLSTAIEYEF